MSITVRRQWVLILVIICQSLMDLHNLMKDGDSLGHKNTLDKISKIFCKSYDTICGLKMILLNIKMINLIILVLVAITFN